MTKFSVAGATCYLVLVCAFSPRHVGADEGSTQESTTDFTGEVAPLFAKNCVACHNAKKPEGGLSLESFADLMKGGDSGTSVDTTTVDASELLIRIASTESPMPPADNAVGANRLTEAEMATIRNWIAGGAQPPTSNASVTMNWQPLAPSVLPINSMVASSDGNYLAAGRGNQALVLRQPATSASKQSFALVDPAVAEQLSRAGAADAAQIQAAQLDVVQSVAFSPDSSTVAVGGYRSVKLWQRQLQALESVDTGIQTQSQTKMAISPDGKLAAIAADGRVPEIVDLTTWQTSRSLKSPEQSVTVMAWIDDSRLLSCDSRANYFLHDATAALPPQKFSGDSLPVVTQIGVIDLQHCVGVTADGKLTRLQLDLAGHLITAAAVDGMDGVQSMAIASTGPVAVGLSTGVCRLVDRESLTLVREFPTSGPVIHVAIDAQANLIATATGSAPAQLWRMQDGTSVATLERDYHFSQQVAAAQRTIARQNSLIERLTAQQAELKKAAEAEQAALAKVQEARDKAATDLTAHETAVTAANQAVTDGQTAIAEAEAAVAAAMKLVETRKTELEAKQKAATDADNTRQSSMEELAKRDQALATSKDATERALARLPEIESLIQTEQQHLESDQQAAATLSANPLAKHVAKEIAFTSAGDRVAVADESGRIHLFDSATGAPEANLELSGGVCSLTASTNNQMFSLTESGQLQRWDTSLAWHLTRIIGNFDNSPFSDRITALDFSPDGLHLAVGSGPASRTGEIKIVDVKSGQVLQDFTDVHNDTVLALRYSPDGRKLATGAADKLCRILDSETGKILASLEGHTHHVLCLAWKDDGVFLATGSSDQNIKVWNVETATQIRTIGGAKKEVTGLGFVGQSNQFVAADAAGTIRLMDAGGGNQVRTFTGADSAVITIAVSPDGNYLYAGGQSGQQWTWQISDAKLIQ